MPVRAIGPTYAGGMQPIAIGGYPLLFLPDINNWELQRDGQPPVFYWVPNQVRMARTEGPDTGDYLFNLIRFAGAQSSESVIGAEEDREVAGGVLTFTTTGAPTAHVLQQAQQQITEQGQGPNSSDYFWGVRGSLQPIFRPAIIKQNNTTVSNVSPDPRGSVSVPVPREGPGGSRLVFRDLGMDSSLPARERARRKPRGTDENQWRDHIRTIEADTKPRSANTRDASTASNLDPWYWRMQGEGAGSIDPSGQNAFSALLGAYPTSILWEAFHGAASPIIVIQDMRLLVWSPVVELTIRGEWDRVFEHFSAAVHAHYLWASADIQAEFNNMRMNGTIETELKVDTTLPNSDKIQEQLEKRSDLVFEKFMEEARRVIFEPPMPDVEAAEASSSGGLWGVSVALKYRRDSTNLRLNYRESRQLAYLQEHVIKGSQAGMFEEMKRDPDAERKYFLSVYLSDWPRKLARVVKPVLSWSDGAVSHLTAQIGYPSTAGDLMWEGHKFEQSDAADDSWKYRIEQKPVADVANPPAGWESDKTFIKRKVHLNEPPSETEDPYRRIQIDRNTIEFDPEPNGTPTNDTNIEVRADSAGRLSVGPIDLGVILQDNTQTVEVTFEPTDNENPPRPIGREPVRFVWNHDDQDVDRTWILFTGDPDFIPAYRYKVRVIVKGTIFEPGREWTGPWVAANGSGPVTIKIPVPGQEGVEEPRALPWIFETADMAEEVREGQPQDGDKSGPEAEITAAREVPEAPRAHGWSLAPADN